VTKGAAEPFAARYSRLKLIGWTGASGSMAALALTIAGGNSGMIGLVLGALGVIFFGGIAAVHAVRLFDRRAQVIIDSDGLYVRSHGEKRIPLRSIKGLHTDLGRVGLTLHKPGKYPIETRHRRFIYRINGSAAREFFGDVWIWSNQLDQPRDVFLKAIAAHRPKTDFQRKLDALSAAE
jgi:hypothetical protein